MGVRVGDESSYCIFCAFHVHSNLARSGGLEVFSYSGRRVTLTGHGHCHSSAVTSHDTGCMQ